MQIHMKKLSLASWMIKDWKNQTHKTGPTFWIGFVLSKYLEEKKVYNKFCVLTIKDKLIEVIMRWKLMLCWKLVETKVNSNLDQYYFVYRNNCWYLIVYCCFSWTFCFLFFIFPFFPFISTIICIMVIQYEIWVDSLRLLNHIQFQWASLQFVLTFVAFYFASYKDNSKGNVYFQSQHILVST